MANYSLEMTLESDTTFGRGDGVAGLIDTEVEQDEVGLPFHRGRTMKGLLADECANLLFLFKIQEIADLNKWHDAADFLFGKSGSNLNDDAKMFVGDCKLPEDLREAIQQAIEEETIKPEEVLNSLTSIRRQTALTEKGSPKDNSLRSMRVVNRKNVFNASLSFSETPDDTALAFLFYCAKSVQRVGLGRNRGRGKVSVKLLQDSSPIAFFDRFPTKSEIEI